MVLREQCVNRMEGEGVTVVDPRKAYVLRTTDESLSSITCRSYSGGRKEHTSVSHNFIGLFEVIHRAYQIRDYSRRQGHACSGIGHNGILLL
jgi:hypothetical protein